MDYWVDPDLFGRIWLTLTYIKNVLTLIFGQRPNKMRECDQTSNAVDGPEGHYEWNKERKQPVSK